MKISNRVKHLFLLTGIVVSIHACDNSHNTDSKTIAEDHNEAKFNKTGEKDAQAVVDAYTASMFEMKLSDSINKYVQREDVRSLAMSMSQAHAAIDGQLKSLADKKAISLPTGLTADKEDKIKDLHDKKIKEVEKQYVENLIADHKEAIANYEKWSSDCTDPDIAAWFMKALPELRKHLDMAMSCQEKIKVAKK